MFDFLSSTTFVFCHLRYLFENEFNIEQTYLIYQQVCNKSRRKGGTCGVGTTYPSGSYVFTPVSFCTLSHHLDLVLSFMILLLHRQFFPSRIFLLLDVELSNLCSLRNLVLYLFYIEFILE
jgi:hypothetical protein